MNPVPPVISIFVITTPYLFSAMREPSLGEFGMTAKAETILYFDMGNWVDG
jgi:hypothetical protein